MSDYLEEHSLRVASPGMLADSGYDKRVESVAAESFIPFGNVCVPGATGTVKVGAGSPRGIAVHTHSIPDSGYRTYDVVGCLIRGSIWARAASGAVTADGGAVYFTAAGEVTNVAEGNTLLPHAAFRSEVRSSTFDRQVVLVQLHSPLAA